MSDYVPTSYFEVIFPVVGAGAGMTGKFLSVSGLGMQFEYETYSEGGRNYPRRFFKGVVPQTLILEQGTVTTFDAFAMWVNLINLGSTMTIDGFILLKDHTGETKREWTIVGAMVSKYMGPSLNSMRSELAVSRIEMIYNGCL
jgi:phage tail-like protein